MRVRHDAGDYQARQTFWSRAIVRREVRRECLACAPFADPGLLAHDAPVVWLLDLERTALPARAQIDTSSTRRDFALPSGPTRVHVHFDGVDRQIVTLDQDTCRVTLIVDGALLTLGPVCLQIGWLNFPGLPEFAFHLNALAHVLMAQRYFGPSRRPGTADARHLRNAIIAYDGECARASRRQIAAVIYGAAMVADQWSDPSGRLKAMVKRDVLRGRRLVSGGWRNLVSVGSFAAQA